MPRHTDRDRRRIAEMALEQSYTEAAHEAGVTVNTVTNWVKKFYPNRSDAVGKGVTVLIPTDVTQGTVYAIEGENHIPNPFPGQVPDNLWNESWNAFMEAEYDIFHEYPDLEDYNPKASYATDEELNATAEELHSWCVDCDGDRSTCEDLNMHHGSVENWVAAQQSLRKMVEEYCLDLSNPTAQIIEVDPSDTPPSSWRDIIPDSAWYDVWPEYCDANKRIFGTTAELRNYTAPTSDEQLDVTAKELTTWCAECAGLKEGCDDSWHSEIDRWVTAEKTMAGMASTHTLT